MRLDCGEEEAKRCLPTFHAPRTRWKPVVISPRFAFPEIVFMRLLDILGPSVIRSKVRKPARCLAVESLESRSVLTSGVLAPEAVELIGPAPAQSEPAAALIGPQVAVAPTDVSPLEAQGLVENDAALELAIQDLAAEGEGVAGVPQITNFYAVELFGWVWFEGTVEDDGDPTGLTVFFSGVYGDFIAIVEPDGTFWTTPFLSYGGEVTAYAQDLELNRSDTLSIVA
jgi:hypothetical protein